MPYYDPRMVPAHGESTATVMLVNEAPGPCEVHYQIPSVGAQGGNIYRSFRIAGIGWAKDFEAFSWPRLIREQYKRPDQMEQAFKFRDEFLRVRAAHMTCTNAFPLWPRSASDVRDFVDPDQADVLADENIRRLASEVPREHRVILVCGVFAWLACTGTPLERPASREGTAITGEQLAVINKRLLARFRAGWYMGHTRRWALQKDRVAAVLRTVAKVAEW